MSKTPINYHKENAMTGVPSQECDEDYGPEPRKTDFDGTNGPRSEKVPHGEEKGGD